VAITDGGTPFEVAVINTRSWVHQRNEGTYDYSAELSLTVGPHTVDICADQGGEPTCLASGETLTVEVQPLVTGCAQVIVATEEDAQEGLLIVWAEGAFGQVATLTITDENGQVVSVLQLDDTNSSAFEPYVPNSCGRYEVYWDQPACGTTEGLYTFTITGGGNTASVQRYSGCDEGYE
jgi:hypothetical protein